MKTERSVNNVGLPSLVGLFQAKNCHLPKENILVWEGGKSWRLLLFTGRLGVEVLEPTRSRSRGY